MDNVQGETDAHFRTTQNVKQNKMTAEIEMTVDHHQITPPARATDSRTQESVADQIAGSLTTKTIDLIENKTTNQTMETGDHTMKTKGTMEETEINNNVRNVKKDTALENDAKFNATDVMVTTSTTGVTGTARRAMQKEKKYAKKHVKHFFDTKIGKKGRRK